MGRSTAEIIQDVLEGCPAEPFERAGASIAGSKLDPASIQCVDEGGVGTCSAVDGLRAPHEAVQDGAGSEPILQYTRHTH